MVPGPQHLLSVTWGRRIHQERGLIIVVAVHDLLGPQSFGILAHIKSSSTLAMSDVSHISRMSIALIFMKFTCSGIMYIVAMPLHPYI